MWYIKIFVFERQIEWYVTQVSVTNGWKISYMYTIKKSSAKDSFYCDFPDTLYDRLKTYILSIWRRIKFDRIWEKSQILIYYNQPSPPNV